MDLPLQIRELAQEPGPLGLKLGGDLPAAGEFAVEVIDRDRSQTSNCA
jgi:hypothetical protein